MHNATYLETKKKKLKKRSSARTRSFIFGGYVAVLYNRLNFFKLEGAITKALRRGTNFYTMSAGTGVLCDGVVLLDDYADDRRVASDFEFFDDRLRHRHRRAGLPALHPTHVDQPRPGQPRLPGPPLPELVLRRA